jgi:hypothetical protein
VRRIDRAVEIALRLRQARAEVDAIEGELATAADPATPVTGSRWRQIWGERKCTLCGLPGHRRPACGKIMGGGGAPPVEENGTSPPAVQVRQYRGCGAGPGRVAVIRDQIERGVYVPFADLRRQIAEASNATLPSLWQSAPTRILGRRESDRRYRRRLAAQAQAAPAKPPTKREQALRMRLAREAARAAAAEATP